MPESNKAGKKREQKQNREAGIGDADGRIVRVKDPPKLSLCTICQSELKITKTNTELTMHATSKHNETIEVCFPGAAAIAAELVAAAGGGKEKGGKGGKEGAAGETKAQRKAKAAAGMDDLLNAGVSSGKKKGK
jgi:hypothetical protein